MKERTLPAMTDQPLKDIKKEIYLMMKKAEQMLELSEDAFVKNRTAALDQADELAAEIHAKEDHLTAALSALAASSSEARGVLAVPSHIEKIAGNLKRLNEGIRTKIKDSLLFSDKATQETGALFTKMREALKRAGEAAISGSGAQCSSVLSDADTIIRMAEGFATSHENRLVAGECSPKSSSIYLCMLYSIEDVAAQTKAAIKKLSGA
jgi:Na+/phosphate symporter